MTYPIPRASIWPNVVFDTSSAKGMTAAQAWVAGLAPGSPVEPRDDANSTQGPLETKRSAQDVRHGDTWEARNGRGTVIASNDWPAPTTTEDTSQ